LSQTRTLREPSREALRHEADTASGRGGHIDLILGRAFAGAPDARVRAALIGRGISESKTPHMHMSEGARIGIPYAYRLIDFDRCALEDGDLPTVIWAAASHRVSGLNVTHPFKQAAVGCLDGLSPDADAIGAVNTIVIRGGTAIGHNTDCWGFAESFRREMGDAPLGTVVLLGAGGAGAAVARALFELGARRVAIFDLDREKARLLALSLTTQFGEGRAEVGASLEGSIASANGLVNATPMGMGKYPGMPVPAGVFRRDLWVADIIYFPAETALLRAAAAVGSRTISGQGMAIFQAVRAFELITGQEPDPAEMARHFEAAAEANEP
jgi:shikimate dehydrogenase